MTDLAETIARTPQSDGIPVVIVQLPFPSQGEPHPAISAYYRLYETKIRKALPSYWVAGSELWEAPLWVAHLDGAIDRDDTRFIDLSRHPCRPEDLAEAIADSAPARALCFFSPLAQNLSLTAEVSRRLRSWRFETVLGGNMVDLADPGDFSVVYRGLARGGLYGELLNATGAQAGQAPRLGRRQAAFGYRPDYKLLEAFADRVPLVRLNASHGCLYACTFCGDAWTKQLHVVPKEDLRREVADLRRYFPSARVVYIGDKTFGQSREAVENLMSVIPRDAGYSLVVQTHVAVVDDWLLDAMAELGVRVVELGFESASSDVLRGLKKIGGADSFYPILEKIRSRGIHSILNVLGGLPNETNNSHADTLRFLRDSHDLVLTYNLYNFVPYPKAPIFPAIRDRIFDWDFGNWREDRSVVFHPFNMSAEESWQLFLSTVSLCTSLCETP